jgi:hypothetical protein
VIDSMNPTTTINAQRRRLTHLLSIVLTGLVLTAAASVRAEPYLAIQEGYKCSKCHVNMTGGGKRTDFANIYVQTRLSSTFLNWREVLPQDADEEGEDNPYKTDSTSSFFTGRLNEYVAIGGDFRWIAQANDEPGSPAEEAFNQRKQNIYLQVDPIPERVVLYQTLAEGGDAREIWGMYKDDIFNEPYYAKVGQFFLPYGLRLLDDTAFTRSVTGFTYGTVDVGLELGFEPGPWSAQLALTNGTGSSLETNNFKRRTASVAYVHEDFRVGASYSLNRDPDGTRTQIYGAHAGAQFGRLGILTEYDILDTEVPGDDDVEQLAWILEFNLLVARGNNLKLTYDYHDPSESIAENARDRYSLVYEWFLAQFTQLRAGYRDNSGIPQNDAQNADEYFFEVHLYF